jgi:hypothetical protein
VAPSEEGLPTPEPARSLVVWGGGSPALARARHGEGAAVVAWPGADTEALARADVPVRPLEAVIGKEGQAAAIAAGRTWARLWGRVPLLDGKSFRDLVEWRGTSLLWLAEAFIRTETAGPLCARLAETALRLLETTRAQEVDAAGLGHAESLILARACTARGVLLHGPSPETRPLRPPPRRRAETLRRLAGVFAPTQPPPLPQAAAGSKKTGNTPLLVTPARAGDAAPLRPLLEAAATRLGMPVVIVPLDQLKRWETRRVRGAVSDAESHLRECRARLRGTPGLHESYAHRGVGFADLAGNDLDLILLGRLPAAVRTLEAAVELLGGPVPPAVVLTPGGRRDDRRTVVAAGDATGVPVIVVHTTPAGRDDVDRADGGPQARDTLLWEPGSDPAPALGRLAEAVRARVGSA